MSPRPQALGVVLAAGASRRARCVKALAEIEGQAFVLRALETLCRGGCQRALATVAPPHEAEIRAAIGVQRSLRVSAPEQGMFASIKRAAEVARAFGYDALVVSLVDHPRVSPATVAALLDAYRYEPAELLRPSHAGRRGHPILVADDLLERVAHAPASSHTRRVLDSARSARSVDVPDCGIHQDLDTRGALHLFCSPM
ncbi:MAG: nucleotidyltransferase family protein [Deltaproteobacteria bacterium]|nr:nucleotidyltransferase family protein [Deltaproteobacteria bacterium]